MLGRVVGKMVDEKGFESRFIKKIDRDRLILRTAPLLKRGTLVTQELDWERMRPTGWVSIYPLTECSLVTPL